jgi:hypothetical protein
MGVRARRGPVAGCHDDRGVADRQNVFVYAMRYRTAVPLARDVVSTTTVACIPALVVIAALLG